jgi:mRNA-degrading endonuclease RelE of RelBE toxin-antitoxin system
MSWNVAFTNKAAKQYKKLPQSVRDCIDTLVVEIRLGGPVRGNWPNYSKLSGSEHHCHLKKGRPTYVAVWREDQGQIRFVVVIYVGTLDKAPY